MLNDEFARRKCTSLQLCHLEVQFFWSSPVAVDDRTARQWPELGTTKNTDWDHRCEVETAAPLRLRLIMDRRLSGPQLYPNFQCNYCGHWSRTGTWMVFLAYKADISGNRWGRYVGPIFVGTLPRSLVSCGGLTPTATPSCGHVLWIPAPMVR